jgi:hypothetical protein
MTRCEYKKAYTQHKSNAKQRGIEMRMTFDEWKGVWVQSGLWEQRGRGADKYCMCRYNDEGHYEVDNVFIATNSNNLHDGNIGKVMSDETRAKISKAKTGKERVDMQGSKNPMHHPDVKAKISAAVGGSNNYQAKGVISPFGQYGSTTEAARDLGIPVPTIQWRCRHNKAGWSYGQSNP